MDRRPFRQLGNKSPAVTYPIGRWCHVTLSDLIVESIQNFASSPTGGTLIGRPPRSLIFGVDNSSAWSGDEKIVKIFCPTLAIVIDTDPFLTVPFSPKLVQTKCQFQTIHLFLFHSTLNGNLISCLCPINGQMDPLGVRNGTFLCRNETGTAPWQVPSASAGAVCRYTKKMMAITI